MTVKILLFSAFKCASCAGMWISSIATISTLPTQTISPISAPIYATIHYFAIIFSASMQLNRITLLRQRCPLNRSICHITADPASQNSCLTQSLVLLLLWHQLTPDHSIWLIGPSLSDFQLFLQVRIFPSNRSTILICPPPPASSPTLIGLFMGLTVGILCIPFTTVAFPSASCWQQTHSLTAARCSKN